MVSLFFAHALVYEHQIKVQRAFSAHWDNQNRLTGLLYHVNTCMTFLSLWKQAPNTPVYHKTATLRALKEIPGFIDRQMLRESASETTLPLKKSKPCP